MPEDMADVQENKLVIPIAIVVAAAVVGGALWYAHAGSSPAAADSSSTVLKQNVPAVTSSDHIVGSINASVKIVEYTDLECPFCKQFAGTMAQVMQKYPGKVAWVMRNFPLQQLHPNAPALALAAECVADLGGNDAYWKFLDSIILQAPINTYFDMTKLTATAEGVGVDGSAFNTCATSPKFQDKVSKEFNDAVAAGAQGTPFSVLITKDGTQIAIPGAQPIEAVEKAIDAAL